FAVTASVEGRSEEQSVRGGRVHLLVEDLLSTLPARESELNKRGWNTTKALKMQLPELTPPVDLDSGSYYGSRKWREDVRESLVARFPEGGPMRRPLFHVGPAATGNTLMKNSRRLAEWRKATRDLTHVEME